MRRFRKPLSPVALRLADVSKPLEALNDVLDHNYVQVLVTLGKHLLGTVNIPNLRQAISEDRLREAIVDNLFFGLLEPGRKMGTDAAWANAVVALTSHYLPNEPEEPTLPIDVPVSVVVATRDRPVVLKECLRCLVVQKTTRRVEIVVVDNNPDSGLTPPVVAEFPEVTVVTEGRKGLSYARNTGFTHCTGDIAIAVDDDVTMLPHWLEKMVTPFARSDVMAVTGNVLPFEMETIAQQLFETYGGLGRGFEPFEATGDWFEGFKYVAVPTWNLGATANAAFRVTCFSHPEIGLLDEALGAGTPTGCSEDTYLFYKILKAGYTVVYKPEAYVWHKHRRDMRSLRRLIYNYSKGHVAYHLTTLLRDYDLRAMTRLLIELPKSHLWKIRERLRGRSIYPLWLIMVEIIGNLVGPFALWKSRRRVKNEGQSEPYIAVSQRLNLAQSPQLVKTCKETKIPSLKAQAR